MRPHSSFRELKIKMAISQMARDGSGARPELNDRICETMKIKMTVPKLPEMLPEILRGSMAGSPHSIFETA